MEWSMLLALGLAAFAIGLGKGGLGSALAGSVTPLLTLIMPPVEAVGLMLPLFLLGDVLALRFYWREWDRPQLALLLPAALPGVLLGTYLLTNLPSDLLRVLVALFALLIAAYKLLESRLQQLRYHPAAWHGWLAGGLAGTAAAVASAGGMPFTAYLLLQGLTPRAFIGTTTLFFVTVNLLRLPGLLAADILHSRNIPTVLALSPFLWLGALLGQRLITRIDAQHFNRVMIALLMGAGLLLLLQS